jgi:hypothetical protein
MYSHQATKSGRAVPLAIVTMRRFVRTRVQRLGLLLPFLLLSSCVTSASLARTRASHEFKCPEEQVVLRGRSDLSEGTYDVEACGRRARYTCTAGKYTHICAREPLDEGEAKQKQ